jgi:hypothetical protein
MEQKVLQTAKAEPFKLSPAVRSDSPYILETQAEAGGGDGHGAFIMEGPLAAKTVVSH